MPRRRSETVFGFLYDKVGSLDDCCYYCGEPSWGWDHVPPLAHVERLPDEAKEHVKLRKIPACGECNSILNNILLTHLLERRAFVKAKLRKKYKAWLTMPEWDEDELAQLSTEDARKFIKEHMRMSSRVKRRLEHR